jgi:hypothetical protein
MESAYATLGPEGQALEGLSMHRIHSVSTFALSSILLFTGCAGKPPATPAQVATATSRNSPPSGSADARLPASSPLVSYLELQKSDFYGFFGLREVARQATAGGLTIRLEPGGHASSIDLELSVDETLLVTRAELLLARDWVGDAEVVNMFATDIAGSFLTAFSPSADREQLRLFSAGLKTLHGSKQEVIHFRNDDTSKASLAPDVVELRETFVGKLSTFDGDLRAARLHVANGPGIDGRPTLRFTMIGVAPVAESKAPSESVGSGTAASLGAGATLEQQVRLISALFGAVPLVLLNERYRQNEPAFAASARPARDVLLAVALINTVEPENSPVTVNVFDGRMAHTINITSTSANLEQVMYWDPWGEGSFLQAANNAAGVDVVPSPTEPRIWIVRFDDVERVLYAAIILPESVKLLEGLLKDLKSPRSAVQTYSALRAREPKAHLAQPTTWRRLTTIFAFQQRRELATNARKVADALEGRTAQGN